MKCALTLCEVAKAFQNSSADQRGQEMRISSKPLVQFLVNRDLLQTDELGPVEKARRMVEKSGLVQTMMDICVALNETVGGVIVDAHTFLPPEPLMCCFIFVQNGRECFLRLELRGATPTLVFAERQWRDSVSSDFVRWVYRLAAIEPMTVTIKKTHAFRGDCISVDAEQVQQWFLYLISGMDGSYVPSF